MTKKPDVYLDISIDSRPAGRIILRLFDSVCPITSHNFRQLATGQPGFGYQGTRFHRIIPKMMIQGGDLSPDSDGTGGHSVYGPTFPDENFRFSHDRPGLLSMANRGPNTNSSQFFITTAPAQWCDHRNVVFGEIVDGLDVVHKVQAYASDDMLRRPSVPVIIEKCGELS